MTATYALLRHAVLNQLQVTCEYDGHPREMCPHVIGKKNRDERVLSYQFDGSGKNGLLQEGQWRCMKVSKINGVATHEGPWHTGENYSSQKKNCIDEIDVEVTYDIAAE